MGMSTASLAVTGSTGNVGGKVARRLAAAGVPQRLVVRDPTRAPDLPGCTVAVARYGDPEAARRALDGIETVFMVSGAEQSDRVREHTTFIDAAVASGVSRLVYLSFYGASPDATFTLVRDHWATEQHLKSSGLGFTILRDNLYQDFLPLMVGEDGVIRGPAGDGRVAAVAQDDIADVAVAVLRAPEAHHQATYDLTGPEAFTLAEAAETLTRKTGRPVRFHNETLAEAYQARASYRAPQWQVDAWVSTYTAIAAGELAGVSDDVARVAGHPPLSLEALLDRIT
jgi:uncharacterized protein YbjT (DUF2867 family)